VGISYRPSFVFYTDHSDLNSVNHNGTILVNWPLNRLSLSFEGNAFVAPVIVRDIGNRATETSYSMTATADYELSHLTFLEAGVGYSFTDYGAQYINSQTWNEQLLLNYRFTPKLTLGAGVSLYQRSVENGPGQMSEGPLVRLSYVPTPRLTLTLGVGVQFQQFESGEGDTVTPTFLLSSSYQVRTGMNLTLDAHRSEVPSGVFIGQNYSETSFTASISQVLPHRITARLGGGYTLAEYYATQAGVQTHRTDGYYFFNTDLNYALTDAWSLGLYFQHSANSSNGNTYNYDHNIVGLRAGWSF
jgi:hypothetical protein